MVKYYSKEGYEEMHSELQTLKRKGRADIARHIAEARDKGDLSENAEYHAAKDAQGLLELKISKLEKLISDARVLDENKRDISKVSILSKVHVRYRHNKMETHYQLVSEREANIKTGRISSDSPIGKALIGKKVGEVGRADTPGGSFDIEILAIK